MKALTETEQKRAVALVKHNGDLAVGDKCPRDECRGILVEDPVVVFNPRHPTQPMFGVSGLRCENKDRPKRSKYKCDFQYLLKGSSEQLEKWRAEIPEEEEP